MCALRHASFLSHPTLSAVQTLTIIGACLMNSGRSHDARKIFSWAVHLAQSIGLHRDPKHLELRPPIDECSTRQTLWWSMLHMDQQYSVTLGQALSISDIGDCPPPAPPAVDEAIIGLYTSIQNFTILARQILSNCETTDLTTIHTFIQTLVALWRETPAAVRFTDSWVQPQKQLPESPLEVMWQVRSITWGWVVHYEH